MKQISARDGEVRVVSDDKSGAGGKLGTAVAYVVAALVSLIVIGGLAWVAEAIWRAVL